MQQGDPLHCLRDPVCMRKWKKEYQRGRGREEREGRGGAYKMRDVAVFLHHGGYGNGSLRPKTIVTEVKMCHACIRLQNQSKNA